MYCFVKDDFSISFCEFISFLLFERIKSFFLSLALYFQCAVAVWIVFFLAAFSFIVVCLFQLSAALALSFVCWRLPRVFFCFVSHLAARRPQSRKRAQQQRTAHTRKERESEKKPLASFVLFSLICQSMCILMTYALFHKIIFVQFFVLSAASFNFSYNVNVFIIETTEGTKQKTREKNMVETQNIYLIWI